MSKPSKKENRKFSPEIAKRLEIIRLHQAGKSPSEISKILGVSRHMVYHWRHRDLVEDRTELKKQASGRSPLLSLEEELGVVNRASEYRSKHGGQLNVASLAHALNLSYGVVRRALLKHDILPSKKLPKAAAKSASASEQKGVTPTQRDVSRACGYSQSTVSRALKNDRRVSSSIRQEIQSVATRIGYRLNAQLTSLSERRWKSQKSYLKIAYLAAGAEGSFLFRDNKLLYEALLVEAEVEGYTLEWHNPLDYSSVSRLLQVLYHRGVECVIAGFMLRKEIGDELFDGVDWSAFSVISCGRGVISHLNSVRFEQVELALRHSFEEGVKCHYGRIGYLYLPVQSQIATIIPWKGSFVLGLIEQLQTDYFLPDARIPSLLLEDVGEDYELKSLDDYLQIYEPDLLLCNCDRGFELLKQIKRTRKAPVAFVSLDKEESKTNDIAGVTLSGWPDYAKALLERLKEQVQHNEFGLPQVPRTYGISYREWCPGKSLSKRVQKKSKLEWRIQNENTEKEIEERQGEYHYLDLRAVANGDRRVAGQWIGNKTLELPEGMFEREGDFRLIVPGESPQNNILMMRSLENASSPRQSVYPEQVTLPINAKLAGCRFLHTGGYIADLKPFASYSFVYRDGRREKIPLVGISSFYKDICVPSRWEFGDSVEAKEYTTPLAYKYAPTSNIGDWFGFYTFRSEQIVSNAKGVIVYDLAKQFYCYLFTLRWENPYPEKEVVSLEIQSSADKRSTLAVLGITLELF